MRAFSAIVAVAGLIFLVACGGSSTPAGVPITISLSATLTSLIPGQASTITAAVANDSSNKGVTWSASPAGFGQLTNPTSTSVTYTAPANVPTATAVTITATSVASSTVTASLQIAVQTSSISVSLAPAAPQTINQGGAPLVVTATLTNDTSSKGVTWSLTPASGAGTLTNQTTTSVLYNPPAVVNGNTPVSLKATSVASSNATASLEITVYPAGGVGAGPNVAALNVTSGPVGNSANLAFVSLTICVPGTTTCQTVDNIQVDTGSAGLRILQSAIPALVLPTLTDSTGNTIDNCAQFADTSFLWGPVQQADVKMGSEVAGSTLLQVISTSTSGIPTACSSGSALGDENTPTLLAANGILGVGLEPTDCTFAGANFCDGNVSSPANVYFSCPSSGCGASDASIALPASDQVVNPVVLFSPDNNGVVIQMPKVPGAAATASGSLIFGIATEPNNGLGSATLFITDANDSMVTQYTDPTLGLENLTTSIIDSGSNALYFPSSLTVCADTTFFYCPAALTPLTATNEGTVPSIVNFDIDNADSLFSNTSDAAFGTLGGPFGTGACTNGVGACTFDWGLPFFFDRTVFTAIDGQPVAGVGTGPFWAY